MSVINKMLQDLEQRQQNEDGNLKEEAHQFIRPKLEFSSKVDAPKKSRLSWLVVLILLPIIWIGFSLLNQADQVVYVATIDPLSDAGSADSGPVVNNTLISPSQNTVLAEQNSHNPDTNNVVIQQVEEPNLKQLNLSENVEIVAVNEPNHHEISETMVNHPSAVSAKIDQDSVLPSSNMADQSDTQGEDYLVKAIPTHPVSNDIEKNSQPNVDSGVRDNKNHGRMEVTEVKLSKTQLAQVQFKKAQTAENDKRLDEATGLYLEAIILDPSLHTARKQLVKIYYSQNKINAALLQLESGISIFPTHWEFYLMQANIENALQEYHSALVSLSYIDDNSEFAKEKWVFQGDIAQKTAQYRLSETAYRALLTIESTQARWWMGLAYALDSQQEYVKAAAAYRSALNYPGLSNTAIEFVKQRLVQLGENQ